MINVLVRSAGGVAALIQLTFGVLVLAGLWTRSSAIILSGTMAYAYFSVHQEKALLPMADGGEPAALFSWAFPSIAILGAGLLSLDAALAKVRRGTGAGAAGSDGETRRPSHNNALISAVERRVRDAPDPPLDVYQRVLTPRR